MTDPSVNRLQCTKWVHQAVNSHWENLRTAHDRGEKVCWAVAGLTFMTLAMGMPTMLHATYAALVGARRLWRGELSDISDSIGHFPDSCTYVRSHEALAKANIEGLHIPDQAVAPNPDLVLGFNVCQEQSTMAELIHRRTGCPVVSIDASTFGCVTESDYKRREAMIVRQLREEAIPAIERVCGRPFDYARLSSIIANVKETARLRNECVQLQKHRPAPMTIFDLGVSLAPLLQQPENPEANAFYGEMKAELEQRVAQGIGAIPGEKYRLYWDSYTTWSLLGVMSRKLSRYNAGIIIGRYPMSFWPHPEETDPEKPLEACARQMIRWTQPRVMPHDETFSFVDQLIQDFSLDGMLLVSSPCCRMFDIGQDDLVEHVERKLGVPGLVFQADQVDPQWFSEAQIDTRLQALFEMIDARKAARL